MRTDFREYRRNRAPADWSPWLYADTPALISRSAVDSADRNYLETWLPDSADPGDLAGYSLGPLGDVGDVEALVRVVQGQAAREVDPFLALRAGGVSKAEDCAVVTISRGAGQTTIALTTKNGGFDEVVNFQVLASEEVFHRALSFRVRLTGIDAAARAWIRAWIEGDPEPETWLIEEEPLTVADTGRVVLLAGDVRADHRFLGFSVSHW